MEANLPKVIAYRVRKYDITSDELQESRRWMTAKGAKVAGAEIIEGTGIEIDDCHLLPGLLWTERDFNPFSNGGFQTHVR